MEKSHLTRYQEPQHLKADKKGFIQDHSEKNKASISSFHNKSSVVIKSTIYYSSKSITSSKDIHVSEMSSFSST